MMEEQCRRRTISYAPHWRIFDGGWSKKTMMEEQCRRRVLPSPMTPHIHFTLPRTLPDFLPPSAFFRNTPVFVLFRIYTVYRNSSLSFEVCYDIEILTSNTYLAVILVYLNYLFAAYLLTVL